MVSQLSTPYEPHYKVNPLICLEHVTHVDQKWMVGHFEDVFLIAEKLSHSFLYDLRFAHGLHSKNFICILLFDQVHLAISTFTNNLDFFKVRIRHKVVVL